MSGDSTMNATILMIPEAMRPETPSAGMVAPIMPPASAWEDEDGSPKPGEQVPDDRAHERGEDGEDEAASLRPQHAELDDAHPSSPRP